MTYIPTSHRLTYRLDHDRGRYIVKECEPGFCKVPRELTVEERRFNENIDADFILRGPETQKKGTGKGAGRTIKFFTGLQRTDHTGVYIGNVVTFGQGGSKVRNGVLIRFSADAGSMILRYFPAYYPFPKDRAAFVSAIVGRGLL
ncbi:hypothetical protein [Spirosoma rhododendri]|uniref:Uncharacterized protein n=1 Tax=Spirosoma rhododendri TaxID=2728024 RepID=A0A7L5DID9_9BACT|nr:hypothetical protein [Spirosoma rhododendri]QJD77815.1 hypothetical protein HH216_04775 [Spirosoma rhododendri]